MSHYTLLYTQQVELRADDLVVTVFRVSQVIVLMSAVTVNRNSAPIARNKELSRFTVDISHVETANSLETSSTSIDSING